MSDNQNKTIGVSRRTIARGMAWSVPAVAVASAAPAFAASGGGPVISISAACKIPGNSCGRDLKFGYAFSSTVTNPTNKTIYICAVTITNVVGTDLQFALSSPALPIAVAPGATISVTFFATSTNSANTPFSADLNFSYSHVNSTNCAADPDNHAPIKVSVNFTETPPNCPNSIPCPK